MNRILILLALFAGTASASTNLPGPVNRSIGGTQCTWVNVSGSETSALCVNGTGRVVTGNSRVRTWMSAASSSCPNLTVCVVPFDTKTGTFGWDSNAEYSTSTNTFTAGATGYYHVFSSCWLEDSSVATLLIYDFNLALYVNATITSGHITGGTRYSNLQSATPVTINTSCTSSPCFGSAIAEDTIHLNSGDVLAVGMSNAIGGTASIYSNGGDSGTCFMTVEQLPE